MIALRETKGVSIGWIFSEPPGPRPTWTPNSGQVGAMTARCWLDEDGLHVWHAHTCSDGERLITMLPWPTWQAVQHGEVAPSIACGTCGFHQTVRINAELLPASSPAVELLSNAQAVAAKCPFSFPTPGGLAAECGLPMPCSLHP